MLNLIDHFRNDVTHSALFVRLFLLAEGIHVIHCVMEKRAVGDMLRRVKDRHRVIAQSF